MIIEAILNMFITLIEVIFGWINLPPLPSPISDIVDQMFSIFEGSIGVLGIFLDIQFLKILLPVLVIVINFERAYKITMFIIRKLPFSIE